MEGLSFRISEIPLAHITLLDLRDRDDLRIDACLEMGLTFLI